MGRMIVRPASREDIERFSKAGPKPTVIARVGEVDGEIVALGGIARADGRWVAFLDLTEEGRKYKVAIVRTAYEVLAEAKRSGRRFVYAEPDENEPGARRWLSVLGFEPVHEFPGLMRWQA